MCKRVWEESLEQVANAETHAGNEMHAMPHSIVVRNVSGER